MSLQALYYTEMAFMSIRQYVETNNEFYLDVACEFFDLAFDFAPEA